MSFIEHSPLTDVLVFLLAAVLVVPLFRAWRMSPVLGYLAAGLLVGPHGLALIGASEDVHFLAELGIVFLLFTIGLELSVERLKVLRRYVLGLGTLQVLVSAAAIAAVVRALGVPWEAALVVGGGLSLSSTAFVLQMLVERGELAARFGRVSFSILLLQDLAIVPLLVLVPLLGGDEPNIAAALGLAVAKAVAAMAATLLAGRLVLRPVYRLVAAARSPELFVAMTLLVLLGTGFGMAFAGVSMALGAFLAGLMLSGTEYRHQVEADIRPFRGLLLGLFFISVGMGIDLSLIAVRWPAILAGVAALMLGKALLIAGLCRLVALPWGLSARVGLLLSQGGEFAFVLVGSAVALGIVAGELGQIVAVIVAVSMALTPAMAWLGRRLAARLDAHQAALQSPRAAEEELSEVSGHVLIAGMGRVGQTVAQVLVKADRSYVGLDLDSARVRACRGRGQAVFYGDASRVEVLDAAGLERASAAVITLDDPEAVSRVVAALRARSAELPILVRARDLRHQQELRAAGASAVVPETIEASLQIGGIVLQALGMSPAEVANVVDAFRREDYAKLTDALPPLRTREAEKAGARRTTEKKVR